MEDLLFWTPMALKIWIWQAPRTRWRVIS